MNRHIHTHTQHTNVQGVPKVRMRSGVAAVTGGRCEDGPELHESRDNRLCPGLPRDVAFPTLLKPEADFSSLK